MSEIDDLERRLKELERERDEIHARIKQLRVREPQVVYAPAIALPVCVDTRGSQSTRPLPTTDAEKIALFLKRFRCRESVFPKRWENAAKDKSGYTPACANEWKRGVCFKPPNGKVKCSDCTNRVLLPLNEAAVEAHLDGDMTIGTYAIREDDTCIFLAADFDGDGWQDDVFLYQSIARDLGVEVSVERSRSGKGAHAWIFFSEPVLARSARALGTAFLSRCEDVNYRIGVRSYDRLFPNQDCLPRGGFGNLIALPLQSGPRNDGNSLFIGKDLKPFENQWQLLANVRTLASADLRAILNEIMPIQAVITKTNDDEAFLMDARVLAGEATPKADVRIPSGFSLAITRNVQLSVPLAGLPSKLVTTLKRTASFPNPEYYKLQRMRMQGYTSERHDSHWSLSALHGDSRHRRRRRSVDLIRRQP